MGCLFYYWVAYLGEIQKSPYHEWKDSESGHVMSYNQIVSQRTFMTSEKRKKKSWLVHPTFQSWFNFSQSCPSDWGFLSFFFLFFLICFCWWMKWACVSMTGFPLFSLTLITSFTNLQIYYSTVCKGVNAITSSAVSRPVMTNRTNEVTLLKLANFRTQPVWEHRVKTQFKLFSKAGQASFRISSVSKSPRLLHRPASGAHQEAADSINMSILPA